MEILKTYLVGEKVFVGNNNNCSRKVFVIAKKKT